MERPSLPPLALTYHGVADVPLARDPHHLFVRPRDLERQIDRLRGWGYELVTFGTLAALAAASRAEGRAALTFDDGFADNLETLVPILERSGAKATVFVVSGWLGRPHPEASWTRLLTEDELRALAESGVEIGAHTVTHPDLTTLPYDRARSELAASREELRRLTGAAVEVAAYPYGRANDEARAACREAGFAAACRTLGDGSWQDPYDLPRQPMENRASLLGLRLKRTGRYRDLMRFRAARGVRRLSRRLR
ncbi:MAG TPA: polysaccharide deacetylase family protein [Gaiellaceae bacterium]|nr:polysaccharide deacetylase family protein [Gaiellaceae bacterium]